MLTKIDGENFTILPKTPKENERLCDVCGGTGWLLDKENGFIEQCRFHNGLIRICEHCGEDIRYGSMCNNIACQRLRKKERKIEELKYEQNRVNNAKHYTLDNCPQEYKEFFYNETYGYGNGYFYDIRDLEDYCKDYDIEMPKYVWGTSKQEITLDAYDFVSQALEESYEDAFDHVNEEELDKLQMACDEFIKAHNGSLDTYYVNYDVCIDLEE